MDGAGLGAGALEGISGWVRYPPPFGMGLQIRPVYRPDQAEWVRMRSALWPDEGANEQAEEVTAFFATDTFLWSESFLSWKVFVAERPAGGLCGFVEASIRPYVAGCATCPVGYIEGWYVDPDMRRQEIGGKLVEAAERWAAAQGCKEMASDAHLWNTVSLESHKALGFEEAERLVHFHKWLNDSPEVTNCAFVSPRVKLLGVAGSFAVCKLPIRSPIPPWAMLARFAHRAYRCLASTFTDVTGRRKGAFGFSKLGYPPLNPRFSPVFRTVSPQATPGRLVNLETAHLSGSKAASGKTLASSPRRCATKLHTA